MGRSGLSRRGRGWGGGPPDEIPQRRADPIMKLRLRDLTVLKEEIEFGSKRDRLSVAGVRGRDSVSHTSNEEFVGS